MGQLGDVLTFDLEQRDVRLGIVPDDLGGELARSARRRLVRRDLDVVHRAELVRARILDLDHVVVGQDVAVAYEETRPEAVALLLVGTLALGAAAEEAEEPLHRIFLSLSVVVVVSRVVERVRALLPALRRPLVAGDAPGLEAGGDVDDGRTELFHDRGERRQGGELPIGGKLRRSRLRRGKGIRMRVGGELAWVIASRENDGRERRDGGEVHDQTGETKARHGYEPPSGRSLPENSYARPAFREIEYPFLQLGRGLRSRDLKELSCGPIRTDQCWVSASASNPISSPTSSFRDLPESGDRSSTSMACPSPSRISTREALSE